MGGLGFGCLGFRFVVFSVLSLGFRFLGLGFGAGFGDSFREHTGGLWGFDIYVYMYICIKVWVSWLKSC